MPDLETSDHEQVQPTQRAVSTPIENFVSKEEFEILAGKVNDLFVKIYNEEDNTSSSKDDLAKLERKIDHLEGTLLPDLKLRIKTVKKSIPTDAALPNKNKELLEQVRGGLERARAKIAILEQPKQDQKFKLSESSIGTLFGKRIIGLLFFNHITKYFQFQIHILSSNFSI